MSGTESVALGQTYRELSEVRRMLAGIETTMLTGTVNSLADTTDKLMAVTNELREQQLQPWVDTVPAAKHMDEPDGP